MTVRQDRPLLHSAEFWNAHARVAQHFGQNVRRVEAAPVHVRQRNCEIRSLRLVLDDGSEQQVIAKDTLLQRERFKDDEHYARTRRAYHVEVEFYERLAQRLQGTDAKTPTCFYSSVRDAEVLLVLEDLSRQCEVTSAYCERNCQRQELNERDAKQALKWLAAFHSAFLGGGRYGGAIWERGSYWSLAKRRKEWEKMSEEWRKTCENFEMHYPSVFSLDTVQTLAQDLAEVAQELDADLAPDPALQTLLHGDFKTANLFFRPEGVAVCDFQWTGPGLGVVDAIYLLFSSVEQSIVFTKEHDLLFYYYDHFLQYAAEKGIDLREHYSWSTFKRHAEIAYLDYVRFSIGSFWGSVTPTTHTEMASLINVGMYRRNPDYLIRMIRKAEASLASYKQQKRQSTAAAFVAPQMNEQR